MMGFLQFCSTAFAFANMALQALIVVLCLLFLALFRTLQFATMVVSYVMARTLLLMV
jgi:hypothetical protein